MSDTPKKKTTKPVAAKKKQAQKSAQPKGTGKPGRPRKVVEPKPEPKEVHKDIQEFVDELDRIVKEEATPEKEVVIHPESVKKPSLRKRMLRWFK